MTEPTAIVPDKGIRAGLSDGGAIVTRLFVKAVAGPPKDKVALAGAGERVMGVTMEAIADGERGDIQVEGRAVVTSGAAVADGASVASDAAGKAVTAASGNITSGTARTAVGGADLPIEIELHGPGGGVIAP